MALTFRKRIRVLPFLWLNLGMRGISVTIGLRPVMFTLGRGGIWFSTSLPGTGLGYRKKLGRIDGELVRVMAWPTLLSLAAIVMTGAWYYGVMPQAWAKPALHGWIIALVIWATLKAKGMRDAE